jgi:hypothetical protein
MNNLDYDPIITRKRVYYEGSDALKAGYALCYNHDTTTNWWGFGELTYGADKTEQSVTAEGEQNEGKWMRVEKPATGNLDFFAGVVSQGQALTGPCFVDIDVPNGGITVVQANVACTTGVTKLYVSAGSYYLMGQGTVGAAQRCVGMAMETYDRSSTAGPIMARLVLPTATDLAYDTAGGDGPSALLWADCPWSEMAANPGLGFQYFNDFAEGIALGTGSGLTTFDVGPKGITGWVSTVATQGTMATVAGGAHGQVKLAAGTTTDDVGIQAQLTSACVDPAAGKTIWFECRAKLDTGSDQYFMGLASVDTTLIASGALDETNPSYVGFARDVNTAKGALECVCAIGSGGQQANATGDCSTDAGTFHNYGVKLTSTAISYYVDGVLVDTQANTTTASIPTAAVCLSFVSQSESMTTKDGLTLDWVRLAQLR